MSSACVRGEFDPLALMLSADPLPHHAKAMRATDEYSRLRHDHRLSWRRPSGYLPVSPARAKLPPFSGLTPKQNSSAASQAGAHLRRWQRNLRKCSSSARMRVLFTASRTPIRCGCGRRADPRRSPSSCRRGARQQMARIAFGDGAKDQRTPSGPADQILAHKAEDMTAPTDPRNAKNTLDQRAASDMTMLLVTR